MNHLWRCARRTVGELTLIDPPIAEVGLDVVVSDPPGRVQRSVDVVLGDLSDERLARRRPATAVAWLAQTPA